MLICRMNSMILKSSILFFLSRIVFFPKESGSIGPGTYYNEKLASSIKIQSKPPELQNFGSSSLRFNQKQVGFKTLGPGKYDTKIVEASVNFSIF